jgi:hypothetical protein
MQKSVRPSCIAAQKPCLSSNGALVVDLRRLAFAYRYSGCDHVKRPRIKKVPHTISVAPTNGPMNCGAGIPIFSKRPAPSAAGKRNFWMPSERKIQPTRKRTRSRPHPIRCCDNCFIRHAPSQCEYPPLNISEQGHEAEVHMQLLVAVKQGEAGIVRNEIDLGFLVSSHHHDIFDYP